MTAPCLSGDRYQLVLKWAAEECSGELWKDGFPPHLEGLWWYRALERSGLEDQFQFLYFEVQTLQGTPVALAPAFIMDVPLHLFVPDALVPIIRPLGRIWPQLIKQRTLFIGSPCSDEGHIGFRSAISGEDKHEIFKLITEACHHHARSVDAPMLIFKDFPTIEWAQGPLWRHFFVVESFPGSVTHLPSVSSGEATFEDYLMSLKGSRRQKLRRTLRRAHEAVALETAIVKNPDPALLETLVTLFSATFEAGEVQFERLGHRFFEEIGQCQEVEFLLLKAPTGEIVAFMMLFTADPSGWINKFIGLDYARPKEWFLYFQLWEAAVRYALSRHVRTIQSGQTDYDAKISVGHQIYPLKNLCYHRNPVLHWIYKTVGGRVQWSDLDPALKRIEDPS